MDISKFTTRIDDQAEMTPDMFVVRVHRYDSPEEQFGWHMLVPTTDGWSYFPLLNLTLGLFRVTDSIDLQIRLMSHGFIAVDPAEFHLSGCSRFPGGMDLQHYLIHQVCPIEFQARMDAGDTEMLRRLEVFMLSSQYILGNSKAWAKKDDLKQLARLRERITEAATS